MTTDDGSLPPGRLVFGPADYQNSPDMDDAVFAVLCQKIPADFKKAGVLITCNTSVTNTPTDWVKTFRRFCDHYHFAYTVFPAHVEVYAMKEAITHALANAAYLCTELTLILMPGDALSLELMKMVRALGKPVSIATIKRMF